MAIQRDTQAAGLGSAIAVVLVALVTTLVGCGAESNGLAPVSGTVTLNGEPVTHGHVYAKPADGRTATGRIRPDGTFTLGTYTESDGARIGQHTVTLSPPRADEGPVPAEAVVPPARYTSPRSSKLRLNVPPEGVAAYRIDLEASEAEVRASKASASFIE